MEAIDIVEELKKAGLTGGSKYEDEVNDLYFYVHGKDFYFRGSVEDNFFHVGVAKYFDRWANSRDAEFPYPYTSDDLKPILEFCQGIKDGTIKARTGWDDGDEATLQKLRLNDL